MEHLENKRLNQALISTGVPWHHGHDYETGNLGFGYLYYSLVRILRPRQILCIGSGDGFVPMCLAHGVQANQYGKVHIVEPGYYNEDAWVDRKVVKMRFKFVGVDPKFIRHYKMTNKEFFKRVDFKIDLLFIDGAIDQENVEFDFYKIGARVNKGGYILLHDIDHSENELLEAVYRKNLFELIKESKDYEYLSIMSSGGLGIIRKLI